jgi:hypothetical protein
VIDTNPIRRFERLEDIQGEFEAFAPFWYFKGSAARELYNNTKKEKYKEEAVTAFNTFYKYNFEFMRSDLIAASCALEHISILDLSTDEALIRELIEYAERFAKDNFDTLQMCTQVYLSLKEFDKAEKILRRLCSEGYNISLNGIMLSRLYYRKNDIESYKNLQEIVGVENTAPWEEKVSIEKNQIVFPEIKTSEPSRISRRKIFGSEVYSDKFSLLDVYKWIKINESHLSSGRTVIVTKLTPQTTPGLFGSVDFMNGNYLLLAVMGKEDKLSIAKILGKDLSKTDKMYKSLLVNYNSLDNQLENALEKDNGRMAIEF